MSSIRCWLKQIKNVLRYFPTPVTWKIDTSYSSHLCLGEIYYKVYNPQSPNELSHQTPLNLV